MFRIDGPGATNDNKFTEGDPASGTRATVVTDGWLNAVQEEIANAIEGDGGTLEKSDSGQLREILSARIIRAFNLAEHFGGRTVVEGQELVITGWHEDSEVGGGEFVGRQSVAKSQHNGGTVISPTVPKVSEQEGSSLAERTANFLAGAGETDPGGTGVFVRKHRGTISFEDFGAVKGEDSSASILAALATNLRIEDEGVYKANDIVFPENSSVTGRGGRFITFQLANEGRLADIENTNTTLTNVVFDGGNIPILTESYRDPVNIPAGTVRPRLKNVHFKNWQGGEDGALISRLYGLTVSLSGVKDFEFEKLYFENLSNLGDGLATENGFVGGVFFFNGTGSAIAEDVRSSGSLNGVFGYQVRSRFPGGLTDEEKDQDQDADLVRLYDGDRSGKYQISIRNLYGRDIQKRFVKNTGCGLQIIENVFFDGTEQTLSELPLSVVIDQREGDAIIRNVHGQFGVEMGTAVIRVLGDENSRVQIDNIITDNCLHTVQETGSGKYLSVENVEVTLHGGLHLESDVQIDGSYLYVDNLNLIFDRTNSASESFVGCVLRRYEDIRVGSITLNGAQLFMENTGGSISYQHIKVTYPETTWPAYIMQNNVVGIYADNLKMGVLEVFTDAALPDIGGDGVVRFRPGAGTTGGKTFVQAKNNPPVSLFTISGSGADIGDISVVSDNDINVGRTDASSDVSNFTIGTIKLLSADAKVNFYRAISNASIREIIAPFSNGATPFIGSALSASNVYIDRVYWQDDGATLGTLSGVTVIDERTLS